MTNLFLVTSASGRPARQDRRLFRNAASARRAGSALVVRSSTNARSICAPRSGARIVEGDFLDIRSVQRRSGHIGDYFRLSGPGPGLMEPDQARMALAANGKPVSPGWSSICDAAISPDAPTPRMRQNYLSNRYSNGPASAWGMVAREPCSTKISARCPPEPAGAGAIRGCPWGSEKQPCCPLVAAEDVPRRRPAC